eukprot:6188093-Pleurochrysis_carterae.AAC.4
MPEKRLEEKYKVAKLPTVSVANVPKSLDSWLDMFSDTNDGDDYDDSADSPGEVEMKAVTSDVDNIFTPASDD